MRRPLFLIVLLLAIPAAAWAAFDGPEVADPQFFVDNTIPDQLQVDAAGRAYFYSQEIVPVGDPNDGDTDRQAVVYERCGTAWQRDMRFGLPDDGSFATRPISLEVAPSGDMLAVWLDGTSNEQTIYTSFRAAGGDWGAPQIVEALDVSTVWSDIAPNGDAVLAYQANVANPQLQVAVRTKASGTWVMEDLGVVDAVRAVAMSPSADAIVLASDAAAPLHTRYRPAGGAWGAKQDVPGVVGVPGPPAIAFAPDGQVVLGVAQGPDDQMMSSVRGAGTGGTWSSLTKLSEVDNSAGAIHSLDAATHPGGVVLGWIERQNGALLDDLAVARFNGAGFDTPKVYDVDDHFIALSVGATPSGRAIVAAQHETPPQPGVSGRNRILVGEAQGIAGAWPADLVEVPAQTGDHRDPRVGAGGIVAIGYGVHAGNDSRSEVVADGPSPACSGGTVTATPTPSATATPTPTPPPGGGPGGDRPGDQLDPQDVVAPKAKLLRVAFRGGRVRIRLRLGEEATVTFRIDGKRFAKRTLKAGTRNLTIKPRKKLKRGRHRLTVTAVDNAGNRSKLIAKRFRAG